MKVVYNNETKKLPDVSDYTQLTKAVTGAFSLEQSNLKFFYTDEDGDTITVTNQSDLDQARMSVGQLKLYLADNVLVANDAMSEQILNRSMSLGMKYPSLDEIARPLTERQGLDKQMEALEIKPVNCTKCLDSKVYKNKACKKCCKVEKKNKKITLEDLEKLVQKQVKEFVSTHKDKICEQKLA